jgi:hypothetical protein
MCYYFAILVKKGNAKGNLYSLIPKLIFGLSLKGEVYFEGIL